MKCLTMQIDRQLISGLGMSPGMIYVKDHRPKQATDGIMIHAETRLLQLDDDMIVNVSPELLRVGFGSGALKFERNRIIILRASVRLGNDGFFELVPERDDDKDGALCFFDVGSGGYASVDYLTRQYESIASGVTNVMPFVGFDTVALVAMKPGSSVLARRHSKRWIFFGESVVRETLAYRFDGKTLSLQNRS